MTFAPYTELFPELRDEVRQRCEPLARRLLALTCRAEYYAAAPVPSPSGRTVQLAIGDYVPGQRKRLRLVDMALAAFWRLALKHWHPAVIHTALALGQFTLVQRIHRNATFSDRILTCYCWECFRLAARHPGDAAARTLVLMARRTLLSVNHLDMQSIVMREAVRGNNVALLQRLVELRFLPVYGAGDIPFYRTDDADAPWLDALNALRWIDAHATIGIANRALWLALLRDAVRRGWSPEQLEALARHSGFRNWTLFQTHFVLDPRARLRDLDDMPQQLHTWAVDAGNDAVRDWAAEAFV